MARYVSLQVIKDLRFCQIEKTDHVPSAKATRLIIPLYSQFEAKVIVECIQLQQCIADTTTLQSIYRVA